MLSVLDELGVDEDRLSAMIEVRNKIDLLPYLDFDKNHAIEIIHGVHPGMPILELSAKTGEGLDRFVDWIIENVSRKLGR